MKKFGYFCFGLVAAIGFTFVVAQTSTSTLFNIDGKVTPAQKAAGDLLTAEEFNNIPKFLEGIRLDITNGVRQYVIGDLTDKADEDLALDIEGKLGATEYCNADGTVCKAFDELGAKVEFVGLSAANTGNATGYNGAKAFCNTVSVGSHVCTVAEMTQVLADGAINFASGQTPDYSGSLGQVRVQQGAPGYVQTLSNDCQGWTSASSGGYSPVLITASKKFLIQDCSKNLEFACCK